MNLIDFIKQKCDQFGDKPFLLGEGGPVSYTAFDAAGTGLAERLVSLGVAPGDRVAILHPNSPYAFMAYIAAVKAGAVAVPVNPIYTPPEIAHLLSDSGAKLLIVHEKLAPNVEKIAEPLPELAKVVVRRTEQTLEQALEEAGGHGRDVQLPTEFRADDPAFTFYTSGTTGKPKGVVLSHRNLYFGGANIAQNFGLRSDDVALAVLPMVHIFCIASPFMGSFSSGGSVAVLPGFSSEKTLEAIGRYRVTWFPGVPTMFSYLLNTFDPAKHDVSSLRMGLSGGASMPMDLMQRWQETFGAQVQEAYGLTESTGLVICDPVFGVRKPGSIGIAASGVDAKLVNEDGTDTPPGEVGHLIFRGPNRFSHYHNQPELTEESIKDGWFYTGDHAYRDEEGYYFIAGREQELIITAGYNIYPREIEEVLYAFPGVNEAAVVGVPHPSKGEAPRAFVAMKPGEPEDAEAVLAHCRESLAPYKIPQLVFIAELPKNPTGKIVKNDLPRD
ncbi:MAG: AMP-binding protein [Desulfarculaceae bacterium]|jgi:long-chain acyl-CoA synthetase